MKVNEDLLRGKIYEKGYKLKTFSEEIEMSSVTLSNVLKNHYKPSYKMIAGSIEQLDLTPQEVVTIFFSKGESENE